VKKIIVILVVGVLAGCGPLQPPECSPTVVQPAPGSQITPVGRVDGCADLVAVAGPGPGIILYVRRADLPEFTDAQIYALPVTPRGL
jgi:hypothetical protein